MLTNKVVMSEEEKNKELFELINKDAQSWLAQAKQHKMSADVILSKLEDALKNIPTSQEGTQEKMLAFVHSYMLLIGIAFENLIKGILIGRDPTLVKDQKNRSGILERGGHGITKKASKIISTSSNESNLLQRIEEYLFWAGRYPLPIKFGTYNNSEEKKLRSYCNNDPKLIDALFDKLTQILEQEWTVREHQYPQ